MVDLGKVMDFFATPISRMTYFGQLRPADMMPIWAFILIMWREHSILFVRMLMMGRGSAVPANIWGKSKAVLYAISGAVGILAIALGSWAPASALSGYVDRALTPIFALAAVASVASFLTYVKAIIKSGSLSSMTR